MNKEVKGMKKLLSYGDAFIKQSNWKDLALIKFCLCAIGILWGLALPKKARKPAAMSAMFVFIATYIPLMLKFFSIVKQEQLDNQSTSDVIENI